MWICFASVCEATAAEGKKQAEKLVHLSLSVAEKLKKDASSAEASAVQHNMINNYPSIHVRGSVLWAGFSLCYVKSLVCVTCIL